MDQWTLAQPPLGRPVLTVPQGAGIDLGAFEWHEPGVQPEGGSGGAGTGGNGAGASGNSGGTSATGGTTSAPGASPGDEGDCGCRTAPTRGNSAAILLATLALITARRRRSSWP